MGWVCAKAVYDGRLLDLPMASQFCHALLERPLELGDMASVCPDVYRTFIKLQEIVKQKRVILADSALSADAKVSPRCRSRQHSTPAPLPYPQIHAYLVAIVLRRSWPRLCMCTRGNVTHTEARPEQKDAIAALTFDGVSLEDLSLSFTVPGHDSVALKSLASPFRPPIASLASHSSRLH